MSRSPFVKRESRSSYYLSVKEGKLVQYLGKDKPVEEIDGLVEKTSSKGEKYYESQQDGIHGRITGVELKKEDSVINGIETSNEIIYITFLSDNFTQSIVKMSFSSPYGRNFIGKIPFIDINSEIEFCPFDFIDKKSGAKITGISISQNGVKINSKYTKENPNGLPQPKEITFNGQKKLDWTEPMMFYKEKLQEFIDKVNTSTVSSKENTDSWDDYSKEAPTDLASHPVAEKKVTKKEPKLEVKSDENSDLPF